MKKNFLEPELVVLCFMEEQVLLASGDGTGTPGITDDGDGDGKIEF